MNGKIALTYCHNGMVDEPFMESTLGFLAFDANNRKQCLGCLPERGLYIDDNRNQMVRYFLSTKAEWLMMLDTDIEFKPEQIYGLYDAAVEKEWSIATGLYFSHIIDGRLRPVWFEKVNEDGSVQSMGSFTVGQSYSLAAIGAGFMLVHRRVFEEIQKNPEYASDGWTWFNRDHYKFEGLNKHYGEDVGFCLRATEAKFQIWGDTRFIVDHWKKTRINLDSFRMAYMFAEATGNPY